MSIWRMASLSHSPVTFTGNLASNSSASDLLRSSSNGVSGLPLKTLGRTLLGMRTRDFTVSAKIRKVKKHEYPWPDNADPNVKGGVLNHLSSFKPLKEKPKPVTLDFEKPLMDLQKKIVDVQKMANETGLDFTDQIISLETKYQQALKDLYTHLTPIQRVNIARHPNRPTFLDHVFNITEKFVELHGDRAGYDDPAIVTGIGTINGRPYMFMGHQKGRNTKENIQRNFGMPTPHGYRKALRMMYYADHHGFPIVTFIDTPGAFADLKSEELGQGEAIAHNLRTMFGLKVPIVSIVIGEGGSGGALAIGCANKLLMLENAVFYVASPEACAAILWKTAKASPKAAEKLRITAGELCKLQIADGVIPEPLGGAHADSYWTSQQIKTAIVESMDEFEKMNTEELLKHRMLKFRKIGGFQEGIPVDPIKKVNMKKKEEPLFQPGTTSNEELESEVEKLKQQVLKASKSNETSELRLDEMIEKLKKEVDHEFSEAAKALGFKDKMAALQEEYAKTKSSKDQVMDPALKEKIDRLKGDFSRDLSTAPNYNSLQSKLSMLDKLSKAKSFSEKQQEITKKLKEVTEQPDRNQKIDTLMAEIEKSGVSDFTDLNEELKQKILRVKEEISSEYGNAFKSLGYQASAPSNVDVEARISSFNEEIKMIIEDVINSTDLKDKIELLKMEVEKAGKTPSLESRSKIKDLEKQIKEDLTEAMNFLGLEEKYKQIKAEISDAAGSSVGSNGSLFKENADKNDPNDQRSKVETSLEANRSFA